jgi:hypothetical protein
MFEEIFVSGNLSPYWEATSEKYINPRKGVGGV